MRFGITSLLALVLLVATGLTSLLHPTRAVELAVSIVASVFLLGSIPLAIGFVGKRRIQFTCCVVVSLVYYFGLGFERLPFSYATEVSRSILERSTNNLKPIAAPDGSIIQQTSDGEYFIARPGKQFEEITKQELEQQGLMRYVSTDMTRRSQSSSRHIYEYIVAMGLGLLGFLLAGFTYDQRNATGAKQESESGD